MRPRSALLFLLPAALLFGACKKAPSIDLSLSDPCGLRADATCDPLSFDPSRCDEAYANAWCSRSASFVEVAVFEGSCPSDDTLANGDVSTAVFRQSVPVNAELPELGDFKQQGWGFAAFLRGDDCNVVGYGCTNADLSRVRNISIRIDPGYGKGACGAGASCVGGSCTSGGGGGPDGGDGGMSDGEAGTSEAGSDAGAPGCDLALVASGKLPDPVGAGATEIGPAITATNNGFLVAWREVDAAATASKLYTLALGDDGLGGSTASSQPVSVCPGVVPPGGLGLAFAPQQNVGLAVTAQTDCNDAGAGATFLELGPTGTPVTYLDVVGLDDLTLSPTGAVSPDRTGAAFQLAYLSKQSAHRIDVVAGMDISLGAQPVDLLPGQSSTFAALAASPDVRATLADQALDGGTQTVLEYGPWDGGAPKTALLDAGAPAAVAAWSKSAIAVAKAADGKLAWEARTLDGVTTGGGALGTGPYGAVDVAATGAGDHVVVAAAGTGAISLFRIDGAASTKLTAAAQPVKLGPTVGTGAGQVSLGAYDGKALAVAAARQRVAIAWTTKRTAATGVPAGGWALLACKP